jgi:hypothetical protein
MEEAPQQAPPSMMEMLYSLVPNISEANTPLDRSRTQTIIDRVVVLASHITGLQEYKASAEKTLTAKDLKATLLQRIKVRQDSTILSLQREMTENSDLLKEYRALSNLQEEKAEEDRLTLGKLEGEIEALRNEVQEKNVQVDQLREENALFDQHLFEEREKTQYLENDNQRLRNNEAFLKTDGKAVRKNLSDLEKITRKVENDMEEAEIEARNRMITANQEHEDVINQINEQVDKDLATMRKNADIRINQGDERIKILTTELKKANSRKETYKTPSKAQLLEIAELKEQLDNATTRSTTVEASFQHATKRITSLEEALDHANDAMQESSFNDSTLTVQSDQEPSKKEDKVSQEHHSESPNKEKSELGRAEDEFGAIVDGKDELAGREVVAGTSGQEQHFDGRTSKKLESGLGGGQAELNDANHEDAVEQGLTEDGAAAKVGTSGQVKVNYTAQDEVTESVRIPPSYQKSDNTSDEAAFQQPPATSKTASAHSINQKKREREDDEGAEMGSIGGERQIKKAKKSKFLDEKITVSLPVPQHT